LGTKKTRAARPNHAHQAEQYARTHRCLSLHVRPCSPQVTPEEVQQIACAARVQYPTSPAGAGYSYAGCKLLPERKSTALVLSTLGTHLAPSGDTHDPRTMPDGAGCSSHAREGLLTRPERVCHTRRPLQARLAAAQDMPQEPVKRSRMRRGLSAAPDSGARRAPSTVFTFAATPSPCPALNPGACWGASTAARASAAPRPLGAALDPGACCNTLPAGRAAAASPPPGAAPDAGACRSVSPPGCACAGVAPADGCAASGGARLHS